MTNFLPADLAYRQVKIGTHTVRFRLAWGDLPDTIPLTRRPTKPCVRVQQVKGGTYSGTAYPLNPADPTDVTYKIVLPKPGRYVVRFTYEGWDASVVWVDADESGEVWDSQIVTGSVIDNLALQADGGMLPAGSGAGGVTLAQVQASVNAALAGLPTPTTQADLDAAIGTVSGYLADLNLETRLELLEGDRAGLEEALLTLDSAKANAADTALTGEVTLDGATLDVLRLRLKDGSKGFVIRSYGAGGSAPGLYLWGADGHVVGRLTTVGDLESKADASQILGLQAQLDTVPDQIAAAMPHRTVTVHEGAELPQPTAMPFTPRDLIDAWRGYDSGLHWFTEDKNHFARRGTLVLLSRFIDEDTGGVELRLSVDAGDTTNHAVIRDWGGGSSWFMRQEGLQIVYLESPKGDAPFGMPTVINLAGMAADVQAAGLLGATEAQDVMAATVRTTEALAAMLTPGEWRPLVLGAGVTPNGVAQYRHNAGRIELRGEIKFTTRSTYFGGAATLPAEARPEVEHVQPAAMREDGVAPRTGYVTVQTTGSLNFNPTGTVNRVSLGGIWWPEPGFVGPQTRPAPVE